jgi:oligopeptide transport system ATP-binding protein
MITQTDNNSTKSSELLRVEHLSKSFPVLGGLLMKERASVKAVSDVSFSIKKGETLGLVGESGCGKSTLGKCLIQLIKPTQGKVFFAGSEIFNAETKHNKDIIALRRKLQVVFQDPFASLNPRMTLQAILEEPFEIHNLYPNNKARQDRVKELLELVGLRYDSINKYPHEFSGGQRQRIGIARALAVEPELIICDEPVSALDVSIQAQVINLLMDLQQKLGLTYIFIAHDLKVVEHVSNNVAVMYLGKIVEYAEAEELYKNPKHPYTRALLSAIPIPDPRAKRDRILLKGDVPSPMNPPSGCPFHPRCPIATEECQRIIPPLEEKTTEHNKNAPHLAACIHT